MILTAKEFGRGEREEDVGGFFFSRKFFCCFKEKVFCVIGNIAPSEILKS